MSVTGRVTQPQTSSRWHTSPREKPTESGWAEACDVWRPGPCCYCPLPDLQVTFGEAPNYKHEPPQTPPHILLHYCAFKVPCILFLSFGFHSLPNCEMYRNNICNIFWTTLNSLHKIKYETNTIINYHQSFQNSLQRINKAGSQNLHLIIFSYSHNCYNLWTVYNIDFGFVIIHNFILRAYIIYYST